MSPGRNSETLLTAALADRFRVTLNILRTSVSCGEVVNGYKSIEQLGADRWAAIVGAWNICHGPVCVVDAGTAVTIDVIAERGQHKGGIIIPGFYLLRAALNQETSDINDFAGKGKDANAGSAWYGRDTRSAVEKGILFMLKATIDAAISELSVDGQTPALLLSGGDAEILGPLLSHTAEQRPLLVLEGLRHLAAEFDHA